MRDAVSASLDRLIIECGATTPDQGACVLLNVVSAIIAAVHIGQGEEVALNLLEQLRVGVISAEAESAGTLSALQ